MGDKVSLTVEERNVLGKKVAKLRKEGMVPGVVYGHEFESKAVMAPAVVVAKVWREVGSRQPVELTIGDGVKRLAMIKSAEFDPVKHSLRHLSFHVVKQNEKVETQVPIRIEAEGETEAERAGLVVLQTLENIDISAFPGDLPEAMIVPSAKLVAEGDHVLVSDIRAVPGVEVLGDPETIVASVYTPGALAAQNEEAAGDAEEPTAEGEEGATGETGGESAAEEAGEAEKKEEK